MQRPRFQPDVAPSSETSVLVDPEAYDACEEKFSASLEESDTPRSRFVLEVNEQSPLTSSARACDTAVDAPEAKEEKSDASVAEPNITCAPADPASAVVDSVAGAEGDPNSWKDEVAARLNSYRARRKPKPPRYPSLRLKFDPPEPRSYARAADTGLSAAICSDNLAPAHCEQQAPTQEAPPPVPHPVYAPPPETGRLIEFPRSLYAPAPPTYELAEPVVEVPRILEVPELEPPPPALGGISLPAEDKEQERRPGFEIPLQAAPMSRRVLAMAIDAAIVVSAAALFGYIVIKIGGAISPSLSATETLALVLGILAAGYEYLLLIYTGSTPGLRLAGLRLSRFDGSSVPRRMRQWRVLACVLSAASLGLGFAWSWLDEDALCWHDRITRTYLAPAP